MDAPTVAKKAKPKASSFRTWLEAKPYWEKYLWRLHLEKDALGEADIEACYQFLLEDSGVIKKKPGRASIVFPLLELDEAEASSERTTLQKVENLKNVNAIDDGCVIEFGPNLTVIYGDNGAGKSGIGRLFSNACLSRKPRKLLPDAHKSARSAPRASADFHITDAGGQRVIKYSLGRTDPALRAFAVFDHECALIHLNSENKVEFVPSKIQIFDEVFKSISAIEERLKREIEAKDCGDPTEDVFSGTSQITEFLDALSPETTDKEVEEALRFTTADKELLALKRKDLAKKLKQDVSAQKRQLLDECRDLEAFKAALTAKSAVLTASKALQVNHLLKEIRGKKDIVAKLSAKTFHFAAFKNVGSTEWKALIAAAQKLHEKETASNRGADPTHCLLCRQALSDKEKSLFADYWRFLKSTAETELASARRGIAGQLDALQRADTTWPTFSTTEVAVKILNKDAPAELKAIQGGFDRLNAQLLDWVAKIKGEQGISYSDPKIDLAPIGTLVAGKRKAESKLVDTGPQIAKLNREIHYLEQKQQASRLIGKIKKHVAWLRWDRAVSSINLPAVRGATTRKKTEIMGELVMSRYIEIFNDETRQLDCDFGLKVESHGRDAATIKELKLGFARGHQPSDILSDGEQTVSALADFLTEAKLDRKNSGIVFDDPVTSLDHERRSVIATRLVDEAKVRQVIVLTHDIVFLIELQQCAARRSVPCLSVSMRKTGDRIGVIKPELPWIALDVKKKVGYLKNELPALKKAETGDSDEYRNKVKLWFELLREAWERAVEERLFKGVVQRFNKSVQTQRLLKIDVTPELIKEITEGMTETSKWLHDMAAGMNPGVPKSARLEAELQPLVEFIGKCGPG